MREKNGVQGPHRSPSDLESTPGYLYQPSWSQALRQLHERHSKGWGVSGGPRARPNDPGQRPQVRDWDITRRSLLGPRAGCDNTEGCEGTRAELAPDEREIGRKQTLKPRLANLGISTDNITLKHPRPQVSQSTEATPTCCLCPGHPQPPTTSVPYPVLCQPLAGIFSLRFCTETQEAFSADQQTRQCSSLSVNTARASRAMTFTQ